MKNIKLKVASVVMVLSVFTSCEFGDTNVNPALPADVSAQAIVPAAQAGMAFAIGGEVVRINGLFMQHFEGINAQQFDNYKYLVKASDMDGVWSRVYFNTLNPLMTIKRKADAEDSKYTSAMASILIAHCIGNMADMFGDVPLSDALGALEENFFPEYDSQEDIYTSIQGLLDQAIIDLNGDPGVGPALGNDDQIYGGTAANWIMAANALKVKYYLHLSKIDANAYANAEGALAGAFTGNGDDFQFVFGTGPNEANPQYQFSQDRGGNIQIEDHFFNLLINKVDPRRAQLLEADGDEPSGYNQNFNSGTYYSTINSPVIFMSYAEQKFIEAEIELMGNSDIPAAEAALEEAISASITKINGADDAAYAAAESALAGFADDQERLEQIMTQKYIALYSHGLESWTDYRRTGFPAIIPNSEGNNAFNPNGEVPRRLPYPQTEIDLNNSNVPIKAPNFQDRFWWDKN